MRAVAAFALASQRFIRWFKMGADTWARLAQALLRYNHRIIMDALQVVLPQALLEDRLRFAVATALA